VKKVGGDTSYAGTTNRDYCKDNKIQTPFVKRGRPSQTMKEKAEILYIFFGIHTANVVQLAERLMERQQAEAA